ncbi:MAG TPA: class I SAM-dependent methyltransferase [Candidatus Stackebrandtia faecavium]|nr:class I SAM-dependent methyltransferase [Candidatus Stackebrandtia faecavium]
MGDKTGQQRQERSQAAQVRASHEFTRAIKHRQGQWLRAFVREAFEEPPLHHDYGCGSGDVMRMLTDTVSESHGYDASIAKLAQARRHNTTGTLQLIDEDLEAPKPRTPSLVTMFRFLLTATDEAAERALAFAADILPTPESGLLVCENHGSSRSLRHVWARARKVGRSPAFPELSHARIAALLDRHGFEVVTLQGFSLATRGFYRGLPTALRLPLLDDVVSRSRVCSGFASNVVYVARRRFA